MSGASYVARQNLDGDRAPELRLVAKGRDGSGMTTRDADPGGPSGLKDSIPEPPQAAEPELDGCGLPVQNRWPAGRAGRHAVDPAGATHTFRFHRRRHMLLGIAALALGAGFLANAIAAPLSGWDPSVGDKGLEIWDIVVGLPLVWLGIRQFRVGVQISGGRLIIRGGFLTRTVSVSEIRAITLDSGDNLRARPSWVPRVDLANRKSIWINNFDCGRADRPPDPGLAASLNEFRALLGVEDGDLMTTGHNQSGEPSSLEGSRHGELPPDDLMPGTGQAGKPELDAGGVPAPGRPARDRDRLLLIASLSCGIVSAGLAITDSNHKLAGYQVAVGFLAGGLAWGLLAFLKDKNKSWKQLGVMRRIIIWAAMLLAIVGVCGLAVFTWPNGNWGG